MSNQIKRHFYNNKHYILNKDSKTVKLLPDFYNKLKDKKLFGKFGFKKIGGSLIGDVLNVDKFKSQFAAFCKISWIGMPILDRKYVDAGIAIEPKVVSAIEEALGKKVQTFDPYKYNFDFFSDKDDILGGIPDGYVKEDNLIIEIKTTNEKKLKNWIDYGVPSAYLKQAQLYTYLMKADKYAIVATFLKEEDYKNPNTYPIRERKMKSWKSFINIAEVEDDIQKIKKWYKKAIENATSPKWDDTKDGELLEWLEINNEKEWKELKQKWILKGKLVL